MVRRKKIKDVADQFISVRLIKCNDMDLSLFQFNSDLTFAAVFMNADRTVYARYGSRHGMESADRDVSLIGLAETMRAVLEIHSKYPANKAELVGKQARKIEISKPQELSLLKKYKTELDYEGRVTQSCIHCHQILDGRRINFREAGKPVPERVLYPYPSPDTIGIRFDTKKTGEILRIKKNSLAQRAGLQKQDKIAFLNGQKICSPADVEWVMHHCTDGDTLEFVIMRNAKQQSVKLKLPPGWRRTTDLSWRPTTWDMRRMTTGGIILKPVGSAARSRAGIAEGQMALAVTHVGQYGAHARAKRAGFKLGDIVIAFDSKTDLTTESAVFEYAMNSCKSGKTVKVKIWRKGEVETLTFQLQ